MWKVRPSSIYELKGLEAYYFDRAVTTFGLAVEAAMDEAAKGAKSTEKAERARQDELNRWLGVEREETRFADPAAAAAVATSPTGGVVSSEVKGPVKL